jgi:hypothetical protein
MKTVLETLEAARKLITPEDAWIQGKMACDAAGNICSDVSPQAVQFCSMGAIENAAGDSSSAFRETLYAVMDKACGMRYEAFNDTHTHAEVLAAFDVAIAAEKAKAEAH